MTEWTESRFSQIAELIKDSYLPNGIEEFPYIGLEHVEQQSLRLNGVGKSNDVTSNKFRFKANDVLLGKLRVYFRKVVKPDFGGICSTDIWVLRAKEGVSQDFLFYFVANWDFINTADGGEGGTRMPRADWNFIKRTIWNLPPFDEQKAIAEVLSSLDGKIDLLHRQNATLEKMAETLFRQWFIEDAKPDWEEKPLSGIATFLNGLACQKYQPKNEVDKLPVLKIKELSSGINDNSDWASTEVSSNYKVKNGAVIFAWSASLMVKIWDGDDCILNQHLFKVTSEIYPKWFYFMWCKHHLAEFQSIASSHATTMGHIKRNDLDEAMVLVPAPPELAQMTGEMVPLIDKLVSNNNQVRTLTALRDILLPKLMSGHIRVI